MRKNWLLLATALLVATFAIGAVACDDNADPGDDTPIATEEMDDMATEGMDDEGVTVIASEGILTDSAGNTLYIFDNDGPGVSSCNEGCVDLWPPLIVDGEATASAGVGGVLGTITRDDGSTQATYDDLPLYYYATDGAPGDRNGDGLGGVWHIVTAGG